MAPEAVWLDEADVVGAVELVTAIESVRAVLRMEADGSARTLDKTAVAWPGGTLHALGGVVEPMGLVGTKTWAHTSAGASPLLMLWDAQTGALRAVVEAFALGQLRTASISAVATDAMAAPGADLMAIIGTGKQALAQVAAVAAVRPLRQVRVFSPTPEHRAEFCARLAARVPQVDVVDCADVASAVRSASVVTTATRARDAFLEAGHLLPGTHVNAVGAITPERAELSRDLVSTARLVVSDAPRAAREQSSELDGVADVRALSEVVTRGRPGGNDASPTVFKAMGLGLADVAVGAVVLRVALERGLGRPIAGAERRGPNLFATDGAATTTRGGTA